jgi:hypothetical protein
LAGIPNGSEKIAGAESVWVSFGFVSMHQAQERNLEKGRLVSFPSFPSFVIGQVLKASPL